MDKYHIALTDDERQLLARIDLHDVHRNHEEGHAAYKANREPILALLKSLSRRNAVGAALPDPAITAFEEKVGNPEWVSSSDIVPMGQICPRTYAPSWAPGGASVGGVLQALSRHGARIEHGPERDARGQAGALASEHQ